MTLVVLDFARERQNRFLIAKLADFVLFGLRGGTGNTERLLLGL